MIRSPKKPPAPVDDPVVAPLAADRLRWRCDPADLPFETTAEIPALTGVVGQDAAIEALRFGLESRAKGQHVFVSGLTGTGRMTLVKRLLDEIRPSCPLPADRCYVHNFNSPSRPTLIALPRGQAKDFAVAVEALTVFIRDELAGALGSEAIKSRLEALQQTAESQIEAVLGRLEQPLKDANLALVTQRTDRLVRPAMYPLHRGQPVAPESYALLHQRGEVSDAELEHANAAMARFQPELAQIADEVEGGMLQYAERVRLLMQEEAYQLLRPLAERTSRKYSEPKVVAFLAAVLKDVVERIDELETLDVTVYEINVISSHGPDDSCPMVVENSPSVSNLVGGVERMLGADGTVRVDHHSIQIGSLVRADGGFLLIEARDVLGDEDAWRSLTRALRVGQVEMGSIEGPMPGMSSQLKPEPIPIDVKVILLGDPEVFTALDDGDPDFPDLFKVLAEFDEVIPRNDTAMRDYAGVIARIAAEEKLLPFDRTGVAALIEHGARVASHGSKLTARFARIADIAREASFLAARADVPAVTGDLVRETVARTRRRAGLGSRRFRELLVDGTIRVQTGGEAIGQVNGLAIRTAGPLSFGFPARITATIGPGTAGVINIEREAALSGAIHTKSFYILGGLLRHLLPTEHPLVFDASIAFEQSYGGIDGDSASCAEICCLLSALTEIPLRQDLAVTGAIDQLGNLLPVGGVTEKIEGFYDTCSDLGLSGSQGVIIPAANAGDLMLRHDVVEACGEGRFHVYAVAAITEALGLLTSAAVGQRNGNGYQPSDSVLAKAMARARKFWEEASASRNLGRPGAPER